MARAIVLLLCVSLLMFGVDLSGLQPSSSAGRRIFTLAAIPLLVTFVLVVVRRWRQFG